MVTHISLFLLLDSASQLDSVRTVLGTWVERLRCLDLGNGQLQLTSLDMGKYSPDSSWFTGAIPSLHSLDSLQVSRLPPRPYDRNDSHRFQVFYGAEPSSIFLSAALRSDIDLVSTSAHIIAWELACGASGLALRSGFALQGPHSYMTTHPLLRAAGLSPRDIDPDVNLVGYGWLTLLTRSVLSAGGLTWQSVKDCSGGTYIDSGNPEARWLQLADNPADVTFPQFDRLRNCLSTVLPKDVAQINNEELQRVRGLEGGAWKVF